MKNQRQPVTCLLILIALSGCGDGRPKRVPISGKVTIDGAPVTSGSIRFVPRAGGRPSAGRILRDGSFSMFTYEENDGCPPGEYDVLVSSVEVLNDNQTRYNLPKRYSSPATSGIEKIIDAPSDEMLIELTWDGKPGSIVEASR